MPFLSTADRESFKKSFNKSEDSITILKDVFWYIYCREFANKTAPDAVVDEEAQHAAALKNAENLEQLVSRLGGLWALTAISV